MTPDAAIAALEGHADPAKAIGLETYHKIDRPYLGVPTPAIDALCKDWRSACDLDGRLVLANGLWDTNIFEARIAAAKLLTQARIRPDDTGAWDLICAWVPQFDSWAIADAVCGAGAKRLVWDPSRLDTVDGWTSSDHMWSRRATLVMTLPWTKQNNPKPQDEAVRDRVLGWAAGYVGDPDWFMQKAVAWWLRELSKHDSARVHAFLAQHGDQMKPFARKEASRKLAAQDYARLFRGK
ncbi:DNA alkylation repair protein [Nereida sp. MMG025]|uniref:DNA alkylation repair protein n=1 Tax=Nereida sp. MMG025 TaxID=2909981 RepID=UPI001F3DE19E|nr:DNA alkylation repair protein [Nereida sp. MMG025]MCF6445275.1 DNA alkylation repair protein [Nereida sp. MMG025]